MMEYYYSGTESLWCGNWNHLACRRWKCEVDHPSQVTTQTTPQKSLIKQQLRTDLGRSVEVTTATQLVWYQGAHWCPPWQCISPFIENIHFVEYYYACFIYQTFHQFHDLDTDFDFHRITSGFHGTFATGVACQQGTLTLPDTWFRPPFWDLLMLQLLRPNSSKLPCLYSTFHLEYPLVLSWFCCLQHWIEWQMTDTGHQGMYWTGLNDQAIEGTFRWADGALVNNAFV